VGDVVDHPLGDQEVGQLRQAPAREGQLVVGRAAQRDLLDLRPLLEVELRRPAAGVAGIEGVEAVGV
jgi:flagella basal body P-ring formation protein FlgA